MTLTALEIAQLNKMNKAAQNVGLGTLLDSLESGDVSGIVPAVAGEAEAEKLVQLGANGEIDELVIGTLSLGSGAGTEITATPAAINGLVQGVAGGYKVAYGTATIGTASDTIVTGLATVVSAVCSLAGDPTMDHAWSTATIGNQTGSPAAGSIIIKSWKPTAAGDVTPIPAASVFANVSWIAFGT